MEAHRLVTLSQAAEYRSYHQRQGCAWKAPLLARFLSNVDSCGFCGFVLLFTLAEICWRAETDQVESNRVRPIFLREGFFFVFCSLSCCGCLRLLPNWPDLAFNRTTARSWVLSKRNGCLGPCCPCRCHTHYWITLSCDACGLQVLPVPSLPRSLRRFVLFTIHWHTIYVYSTDYLPVRFNAKQFLEGVYCHFNGIDLSSGTQISFFIVEGD